MIPTIEWIADRVKIMDQTRLPESEVYLEIDQLDDLCEAIYMLRVRGAPAIGIAGAYGIALLARQAANTSDPRVFLADTAARLRSVRPTAVNLAWAVDRVMSVCSDRIASDPVGAADAALNEAKAIHAEDLAFSRAMGKAGAELLGQGAKILTHCNAGGLATGGLGTALAIPFAAAEMGKAPEVYAAETRPLLQGARLTAWEMSRAGIKVTVLADGARAWLMETVGIDFVITGADRVAANGDAANKIGTLGAAILAARHKVPFYIVAPSTTFDLALPTGKEIPVEMRSGDEVKVIGDKQIAPDSAIGWNPAFDVTPAELITGWITEHGIIAPPFRELISN
jgi:methylthioribose-1-phosphate isomerase